MSYRRSALFTALIVSVAFALSSCASTPDTTESEPSAPEIDAAQAFDAALPWLPEQSQAVFAAAGTTIWDALGDSLLPTANPDAAPDELGSLERFRSDLQELLVRHFGFDPAQGYALVVGVAPDQMIGSAVYFGNFGTPTGLPEVEFEGATVYELDLARLANRPMGSQMTLYARPVDEPRQGLVLAMAPEHLVKNDANGEDGNLQTITQLFEDGRGSLATIATTNTEFGPFADADAPVPDAALVSVGDELRVTFEGSEEVLAEIDAMIAEEADRVRQQSAERYEREGDRFPMRAASIYAYHSTESVVRQLDPELEDGRLRYRIGLVETDSRLVTLFGPVVAFGSIGALNAFERYTKQSKASEAQSLIWNISSGARNYFSPSDMMRYQDHSTPWHQIDSDDPDAHPEMAVPEDEKVFPGGANFKMVTSEEVPQGGEKVMPDPQILSEADFNIEPVLEMLNLGYGLSEPTYFRYTYETGPGTGTDATATITAEANFDTTNPERHTVIQELTVDESGNVQMTELITENEFH